MTDIGAFTPEQARMLWQDYLRRQREAKPRIRTVEEFRPRHAQVILQADLPAVTNTLTTPSEATAIMLDNRSGTLTESDRLITVKNRFEDISFASGDYIKVEWIGGEWQPYAGSGGGSHHIWFTIQEVTCHADDTITLMVLPTWYTGGCSGTIPGEDSYGEVEVIDPCNILSLYTVEFLEAGAMGRATYMYPVGETGSYCDGEWILDTICGQPECA